MAVSRRLRFEILRRDDYACRYCGARAPDASLTVDHVKPTALGGTDEPSNLVAACVACNAGKASIQPDSPLVQQVADDAVRWRRAIEEAAWFRAVDYAVLAEQTDDFDRAWVRWKTDKGRGNPLPRPANWVDSIERFLTLGLTIELMEHSIGVAMRNERVAPDECWIYFCGCCWREVDRLQAQAHRYIEADDRKGVANERPSYLRPSPNDASATSETTELAHREHPNPTEESRGKE